MKPSEAISLILHDDEVTQSELARRCEVPRQSINAVLRDRNDIKTMHLVDIASALGYQVVLMREQDVPSEGKTVVIG